MFKSYKSALKRWQKEEWDVAHAHGLMSVTPDIARSYFRHCGIPLCEHFPTINEVNKAKNCQILIEVIGAATAAVVASTLTQKR